MKKKSKKKTDDVDAAIDRAIAMRSGKMSPPKDCRPTWVRPAGTLAMPN